MRQPCNFSHRYERNWRITTHLRNEHANHQAQSNPSSRDDEIKIGRRIVSQEEEKRKKLIRRKEKEKKWRERNLEQSTSPVSTPISTIAETCSIDSVHCLDEYWAPQIEYSHLLNTLCQWCQPVEFTLCQGVLAVCPLPHNAPYSSEKM